MTRNQMAAFRLILFLAGAGVILLAFFLIKGDRYLYTFPREEIFMWVSIGVMYLVFFIPFTFSSVQIANFTGKIPMLPLIWLGIVLYIAISIAIIVLLRTTRILYLDGAIIIQVVLFFLFLICTYFAYFTSSHVVSVVAEEKAVRQRLGEIKKRAQELFISVNKLGGGYEGAQKNLKQSIDDIKYLSPVHGGTGHDLESNILRSINMIHELCGTIQQGGHPGALETEASNLQTLVNERKMLRN